MAHNQKIDFDSLRLQMQEAYNNIVDACESGYDEDEKTILLLSNEAKENLGTIKNCLAFLFALESQTATINDIYKQVDLRTIDF